jgi:AcrR family transcriptional regulator
MPKQTEPPLTGAAATRAALLAAAREEFAEHGNFGSKEKLFDAVMQIALDEVAEVAASAGDDPVEYVGGMFDVYLRRPDLVRLLMWESLHHRDGSLPEQSWRGQRCRDKAAEIGARLGREPSPADARLLLTLKGLALLPLALPRLAELMGLRVDDPDELAALRDHITAFAGAALAAPASGDGADRSVGS